jgi:hypothetical protein
MKFFHEHLHFSGIKKICGYDGSMRSLRIFLLVIFFFTYAPVPSLGSTEAEPACVFQSSGNKKACIAAASLMAQQTRPEIEGRASGLSYVRIEIKNKTGNVILSKLTRVKKGEWHLRPPRTLKKGAYDITLYTPNRTGKRQLAHDTLYIRTTPTQTGAAVTASLIPLLSGGVALRGSKVPVAYIKLVNTSAATATLEGFTLTQRGNAKSSEIIGFKTSDDRGNAVTIVDGIEGDTPFNGTSAYVPLAATLAPREMRIYTLLALISTNATVGKQITLDITSIHIPATLTGHLPIPGVTWTIK